MRGLRKYAKYVITLALWLPALETLQDARFLCQLCGSCRVQVDDEHKSCCTKCRRAPANRTAGISRSVRGAESAQAFGVVPRSCSCPPGCWCRQPSQPQLQQLRSFNFGKVLEIATSTSESVDRLLCVDLPDSRSRCSPCDHHISAQQRCAALCRFLA